MTVQRENIWHPYYEINLEEMDFKEKMMQAAESKKLLNPGGIEIDALNKELVSHDQATKQSEADRIAGVAPTAPKKFSLAEKMAQLRARDELEGEKQVVDPFTVKVRKIYRDVTPEDLEEMMKVFGEITRCNIPMDETGNYKGLAFITFKRAEDCTKCIDAGYIASEFAELPCERAMQSNKRATEMRERGERRNYGDRDGGGGFRGGREGGFRGGRGDYGGDRGDRGGFRGGRDGDRSYGGDRGGERPTYTDEPLRRRKD